MSKNRWPIYFLGSFFSFPVKPTVLIFLGGFFPKGKSDPTLLSFCSGMCEWPWRDKGKRCSLGNNQIREGGAPSDLMVRGRNKERPSLIDQGIKKSEILSEVKNKFFFQLSCPKPCNNTVFHPHSIQNKNKKKERKASHLVLINFMFLLPAIPPRNR